MFYSDRRFLFRTPASRHIAAVTIVCFSWAGTPARADVFVAKRVCIVHSEPNSHSTGLGRLEIGQHATLLPEPASGKWIKVDRNGVQGWVYKPRGDIVIPPPNGAEEFGFWFGNIHAHTSEDSSESNVDESTHEEAFEYARTTGDLDFLAVTPHNHLVQAQTYGNLLVTVNAAQYYRPGQFVPIAGQEYSSTSKGNHVNVFELDAWIDPQIVANGDFKKLFTDFIPNHKTGLTFAQFNHPYSRDFSAQHGKEYGRDDFATMAEWISATDLYVQAIEVVKAPSHSPQTNKPHYDENERRLDAWLWALSKGWHLGPTANQDNHRPNWGTASDSRTVAIASELTRGAIMQAFRARRFYASEDSTMKVTFKAGEHWMGSEVDLAEFGGFVVKVEDDQEPYAQYTIRLYSGMVGGETLTHESAPDREIVLSHGAEGYLYVNEPISECYHFIKVTQSQTADDHNGTPDDAWTSPIWLVGELH